MKKQATEQAFIKTQQTIIKSQGETNEAYALIRETFEAIRSARTTREIFQIIDTIEAQYS